jgi:hypothetical protein
MPTGVIQLATPTVVMPLSLSRAFTETQTWPARVNEYHDGTTQRSAMLSMPRRSWALTKHLPPTALLALRSFWHAQGVASFYFYNPAETNPPYSYDPTGVAAAGRYAVRFASPWSQQTGIASIDAAVELIEVLPPCGVNIQPIRSYFARQFNGYDSVNFGNPEALYITGDWSFGCWLNIPSNGHGTIVGFGNGGSHDATSQFPYILAITDGPTSFNIVYGQDVGSDSQIINGAYDVIATAIPVNTWVYLGASRVAGVSVTLYVGDGATLGAGFVQAYPERLTTTYHPNGEQQFQLGAMSGIPQDTPGSNYWYPGYSLIADAYMWNRAISSAEHAQAMIANPPSGGLVFRTRLGSSSPEADVAGGLAGTVSGTQVVSGPLY